MLAGLRLMGGCKREVVVRLMRAFPTAKIAVGPSRPYGLCAYSEIVVHTEAWQQSPWNAGYFDEALVPALERDPVILDINGDPRDGDTPMQVLTRYQRFLDWSTRAPRDAYWKDLLEAHRALHDSSKPLVRADYDHAIDAWAWMLRLDPNATPEAQLAILFHDIERLVSEADARHEHHARDYRAFKEGHAREGARLASTIFARCGIAPEMRERATRWIARHESPEGGSHELALLNDADVLSFFSLNSPGYLRYFGREQTRRKVEYSFRRLSPQRRAVLLGLRLVDDVEEFLDEQLAREAREAREEVFA
ncbi:DUF4202 family protein [Pendulispora albinea]|uniref:DUF4202 domain-containing protein n=1 Tax=Pendulispora albinea TaxID=2741071 RepID=A0ABZ2LUK6_9BACT